MKALFIGLLLAACGTEAVLPNPREAEASPDIAPFGQVDRDPIIDPMFISDVEYFTDSLILHTTCQANIRKLDRIVWGPLEDKKLGVCSRYAPNDFGMKNYITLNVSYYASMKSNPYLMRAILFHELAHCILGSDHVDDEGDIMARTISLSIDKQTLEDKVSVFLSRIVDTCQ